MSHHHDVINRQLVRHGQKRLSVGFEKMNGDIDVNLFPFVFLGECRCFFFHPFLQRLSDSQEISIPSKKRNFGFQTPE